MVMQMDDFGSGDLENKVDDFEKARAGHELEQLWVTRVWDKQMLFSSLSFSLSNLHFRWQGRVCEAMRIESAGRVSSGSLPAWDNDSRDSLKGTR